MTKLKRKNFISYDYLNWYRDLVEYISDFVIKLIHPEGIYFNKNIDVCRGDIVSFSLRQDYRGLKAYNLEIVDKDKFL